MHPNIPSELRRRGFEELQPGVFTKFNQDEHDYGRVRVYLDQRLVFVNGTTAGHRKAAKERDDLERLISSAG